MGDGKAFVCFTRNDALASSFANSHSLICPSLQLHFHFPLRTVCDFLSLFYNHEPLGRSNSQIITTLLPPHPTFQILAPWQHHQTRPPPRRTSSPQAHPFKMRASPLFLALPTTTMIPEWPMRLPIPLRSQLEERARDLRPRMDPDSRSARSGI